ncbi:MAG TPA: YtxH domain-containing protein [Anaerolineae bacterium]|jgi:gas vesicle protein|nr:YtxH domain-containing protein [Anaerolineae bacterium]
MSDSASEIGAFMAGFVIGGLVGAATALILAPQSGEETRAQIATRSLELRDASAHQYEVARTRVYDTTGQVQEQARIVLDEGRSKMSSALEKDKAAAASAQEDNAAHDMDIAGEDAAS